MDWEMAMRRQAVTEWRDRQILSAHILFNARAQDARNAFEAQLAEASVVDSVWDPAGFAHCRIDALLREPMGPALAHYFRDASAELAALDERFATLAKALARGDGITLPAAPEPAEVPSVAAIEAAAASSEKGEAGWWLTRLRGKVADGALSLANYASKTADWLVQDKVGLRDRLRNAAIHRIATQWMGDLGEPRPVLAQVIAAIDQVAHEARTTLL